MKDKYTTSMIFDKDISDDIRKVRARKILDCAKAFCLLKMNFAFWSEGISESATHSIAVYQVDDEVKYGERIRNQDLESVILDWAEEVLYIIADELDQEIEGEYKYCTIEIASNDFAGGVKISCYDEDKNTQSLTIVPEKKDVQ